MAAKPVRVFERYGAAKLHADRLSIPDKYPSLFTATAAEVRGVDGPLQPTADPADGLKPKRLWGVFPVKTGTAKAAKLAEAAEARRDLRAMLKPGTTVYTNLRHVSRSGMVRHIALHVVERGGRVRDLTRLAARAMDDKLTPDGDAIIVGGCGMDMGFHLVYGLSSVLYPDGYRCRGKKCQSGSREHGANVRHNDGGYALAHRWL